MDERQAWVQRLAQLNGKIPWLLQGDHEGETVLYVGATPWRFQMGQELAEARYKIFLLEAFKPYARHYQDHPWLHSVTCMDVREVARAVSGVVGVYDVVVWWHGPEHVGKHELQGILEDLEQVARKAVVLASPWGVNVQGWTDNNPYEWHRSYLDVKDFADLDYETATLGAKSDPSTWCQILAWKLLEEMPIRGCVQPEHEDAAEGLAVYTAIFGAYDIVRTPLHRDGKYMCFCDYEDCSEIGWSQVSLPTKMGNSQREARMYKALSHRFLPREEMTVWIDGNGQLKVPAAELVRLMGDKDVAVFAHPARSCIYDEARAVVHMEKAMPSPVAAQMGRYRAEGYPERNGLAATTLVVRRHTPEIERFNNAWWAELSAFTVRDQLSFDYVCWKLGIEYAVLPGNLWDNDLVDWRQHKGG